MSIQVQGEITRQTIPVYIKFDDYTEADQAVEKDAVCQIQIQDVTLRMFGDAPMITEAVKGVAHVFDAQCNEDAKSKYDFVGMITLDRKGNMPPGIVRVGTSLEKGGMVSKVYLQIGGRSMLCSLESKEAAQSIANGFVDLLGLKKKDKLGKEFTGTCKVE